MLAIAFVSDTPFWLTPNKFSTGSRHVLEILSQLSRGVLSSLARQAPTKHRVVIVEGRVDNPEGNSNLLEYLIKAEFPNAGRYQ